MKWYAAYTKPRAEKKALKRLESAGVKCFLPLKKERRKWSDRLKTIQKPLFTSYIFVNTDEHLINKAKIDGDLVAFIKFEGKVVSIPDEQIEKIRRIIETIDNPEVIANDIKPGQLIEIIAGSLIGMKGELIRHQGNHKVLIRLKEIGQGLVFSIDKEDIATQIKEI